ncbi:hypothetical protein [Amycolatopsis samaneae]|uniref:Uncharacterized protein n=1 Tax=Amycolatopsis samaneae TaxID=664691 RepID=A0ABW5GT06_9PSEU
MSIFSRAGSPRRTETEDAMLLDGRLVAVRRVAMTVASRIGQPRPP